MKRIAGSAAGRRDLGRDMPLDCTLQRGGWPRPVGMVDRGYRVPAQ